jgi:hypothetical protein
MTLTIINENYFTFFWSIISTVYTILFYIYFYYIMDNLNY